MTLRGVTVVVASYGKVLTIRACLDAVLAADHPDFEVLVVDSGSTDGTLEAIARHHPHVRVEVLPGASLAAALNHGIRLAGKRDVVRVHGDVAPQGKGWLRAMAETAYSAERAGVVGARLLHANGRIQSAGRMIVTGLGPWHHAADLRAFEIEGPDAGSVVEADAVRGALCYLRREAITATGGLDEAYAPAHGDDDDFCLMVRQHGFAVYADTRVRAVHYTPHRSPTTQIRFHDPDRHLEDSLDARMDVCRTHGAHFARKWGFDPRHPDLGEVRRRHGDTAICWRIGEALRYRETEEHPAVDVAFVTCNSARLLPRMLAALRKTRWPDLQVFVVDNGSTDGTLELLEEAKASFPFPFHIETLATNVGVAAALNLAFKAGSSPLVARLDDDTIVGPDWLEGMVPRFKQRPYCGVIGPKVLYDNQGDCLQGGPGREYPHGVPIGDGVDDGRFASLLRLISVRGCCNLYRRSVFAHVGLLDVRYAPSQFDEWDHHIAMAVYGYEALYDGSVTVRHLIGAGRSATHQGSSNANANYHKVFGKWGHDIWERLERGIDLSREGRILPPDGDTRSWLAASRHLPFVLPADPGREVAEALLRRRHQALGPDSPFTSGVMELMRFGHEALDEGDLRVGASCAVAVMDAFPDRPECLALMARRRLAEGELEDARAVLQRALALRPDDEGLLATLAGLKAPLAPPAVVHESADVLLVPPFGTIEHGLRALLLADQAAFAAQGRKARIVTELGPRTGDAVEVHAYGLLHPLSLLDQVRAIRARAPYVRVVLHPCWPDPRAGTWAANVVRSICEQPAAERDALLAKAAAGRLEVEGRTDRFAAFTEPHWHHDYQLALLSLVHEIVVHDPHEVSWLHGCFGSLPAIRVEPWPESHLTSLPQQVLERGAWARGKLLLPGPVCAEHGQLAVLHACRDLPVVVTGPFPDRSYERLCRAASGERTVWVDELPELELAAVMSHAALTALPRFVDRSPMDGMLAARFARTVTCVHGSPAHGVLGDRASVLDPCDVQGLRAAFERASPARAVVLAPMRATAPLPTA